MASLIRTVAQNQHWFNQKKLINLWVKEEEGRQHLTISSSLLFPLSISSWSAWEWDLFLIMLLDNNAVIYQTHLVPAVKSKKRIARVCICVHSPQCMVSQFKHEGCSVLINYHVYTTWCSPALAVCTHRFPGSVSLCGVQEINKVISTQSTLKKRHCFSGG